MKEPIERISLKHPKFNTVEVSVFEKCIRVILLLTDDEMWESKGPAWERNRMGLLLDRFFEGHETRIRFLSESKYREIGPIYDMDDYSHWYCTVLIPIDQDEYEKSLNQELRWIKNRYDYYTNPLEEKKSIIAKAISKIFKE